MDFEKFNDKNILDILSRFASPKNIKVLYISSYIPNYVRTETVLGILKRNKIHVEPVFGGQTPLRYLIVFFKTIARLREFDLLILGFRSHETLPFFRLLTKKPIIFDAFVSVYDTLCSDRKIFNPASWAGRFLKWYDAYLCRIADFVLVDTAAHAAYFIDRFNAKNISYLYLECNRELFRPVPVDKDKNKFVVFWYGKCWPLQGVEVILKAAGLLNDQAGLVFRLVGPVRKKYSRLIRMLNLKNTEFVDYIPYELLPLEIAKSDVCLGGHFSGLDKAKRVIAGKTFQFSACAKKIILGDNPANRELFNPSRDVYFVKMNCEKELASVILDIKNI